MMEMTKQEIELLSQKQPILRVAPQMRDLNNNGHIFGGWVLSQMDIAGGIVAAQVAQGSTATVAIEAMEFISPILARDLISVYVDVTKIGRTSITLCIDVIATRNRGNEQIAVTRGTFHFVALDENAKPRPIPDESRAIFIHEK